MAVSKKKKHNMGSLRENLLERIPKKKRLTVRYKSIGNNNNNNNIVIIICLVDMKHFFNNNNNNNNITTTIIIIINSLNLIIQFCYC